MFKLGNVRMSQLSDATIKMLMIKSRRTSEGEFIPFQSYEMKVGGPGTSEKSDSIFFPWPKTVEHIIDETSPLYDICKHLITKKTNTNTISTQSCNLGTINSLDNSNMSNSDSTGDSNRSPSGTDSASSPTDWDQIETLYQARNDDYEIVVMLEGNIETTGASCHIRTSYLPQEILFGYRFIPIYPKFTDFEYCFDYSKFDQVEPYQHNLMHLNVAHINRHLNYIFDARDELKNYQLTYQNTLNQDDLIKFKKVNQQNKQTFKSLKTVLSAFRAANQIATSYDDNIVSKKLKSIDSRLNSDSSNDDKNNKNIDNHDGKLSNTNKNELFVQINHKNSDTTINQSPYQTISTDISNIKSTNIPVENFFENFDQVELKHSLNPANNNNKKQGRFTIVPVSKCNEAFITENSTLLNNPISFKNESFKVDSSKNFQLNRTKYFNRSTSSSTSSTMSSSMKKRTNILNQLSRKVLGQNHKNATGATNSNNFNNSFSADTGQQHLNHQRTYSLPPIYSQIELDNLFLNDKNKPGRNSLSDTIISSQNDTNKLTSDTVTSQALKLDINKRQKSFFIDDEGYLTSNKNNSKEEI
jgi:hypothetical protein